ncbi:conserved Plasmodium protein, unknown function [Plasmodium gallinaceum]|uniref:CS domain-containing protein n=1 Tax=Plasmodium gallinaceum TaxID=5849 RepID=A0A1J1H0S9_PLAGA|nr:conserved Plasmodium protein, unknown function [Plasmodium gallinaceum]CRG97138.1 conserved Plasmodium protein, unknown function [Plasmodium gallinaceum]
MIKVLFFFLLLSTLFGSQSLQKQMPIIRWGQNSYQLTLIVSIPLIEKEEVKFNENNIYLSAISKHGEEYELNLNLLREIIPEKCSYALSELGLKLKVYKKAKEPCWIRLTKEQHKNNFLIKDKKLSDANDCEEAKDTWLENYKLYIRKNNPQNNEKPTKKNDIVQNIIENLKNVHPNFSLHEF